MAVHYRLVFRGKFLPGLSPEEVAANLAALFKVSEEQVRTLLANPPAIIRTDIDVASGNRYLEALATAGIITHLEPATDAHGDPLPLSWNGIERRSGDDRRSGRDRRGGNRDASLRPDRRQRRGRRKTDHPPE